MHALIIGGEIGGTVAAMALQRANIQATVYEAYTHSAGLITGAYLTVAVNGLQALREIGAQHCVLDNGFPSRSITFRSGTGKFLGEVPIGGTLPDGTVTHSMKRNDLYRALYAEAARRGIEIQHEKRLVGAETTPGGGVVARFADGSEARGDVLIGADGIRSAVRPMIDPDAPQPRFTGLGNIGGFTRGAEVDLKPGVYEMIFGKRAFFGYTVSPDGEVWWFANPPSAELSRAELAAMGTEQWKQRLSELFAGDRGPAVEIISSTDELSASNSYDMPNVPVWHRDAMIIIGDAAHAASPSSGQGASMAMEDAVVLAKCLRDLPDAGRAFASYELLRRRRVERVVAEGARAGSNKAVGPIARVLRDLMMPMFLKRQTSNTAQQWLFHYRIDWSAALT